MNTANPYSPPRAEVSDVIDSAEFQPVRVWSAEGRIGRMRYIAYSIGGSFVISFCSGFLSAILGKEIGATITLLAYIPLLIFSIMKLVQRSHDMNWSGWMSLWALIPFVGLIWIFKAGTPGENDYGAPPPPNTTGVKILAWILPVVMLIGILAAISIPAYQKYVERAKASQQSR